MSLILRGKTVVVTGSTRGIGRAIVEGCAAQGANVVVSSRTDEAVCSAFGDLCAGESRIAGMAADVRDEHDLEALWGFAESAFGGVDVWVNNAGVSAGYRPVDELSPDEIREVVDTNLTGTLLACRLVVPRMAAAGGGLVMNLAGRGYRGEATPYTAVYAATKAAIASVTRSIARENRASGVSVHALVPGMVETDFYRDTIVSPRLEVSRGNVALALDAFGVPLATIRAEVPRILAQEPGRETGQVYSLLTPRRTARGIAKMMWWRMTGRMTDEP